VTLHQAQQFELTRADAHAKPAVAGNACCPTRSETHASNAVPVPAAAPWPPPPSPVS
jgi:hypothetical protein